MEYLWILKNSLQQRLLKLFPNWNKKTFKICLKPLKTLTWGTSPFLPSHWQKSCARPLKWLQQTSLKKSMPQTLKRLKLLVLISTSSSINQKSQRTFLDKLSLKVATTLTKTSVTDVTLPLICLVLTSPNLSLSVTCVQLLSLTLLPTSWLNKATSRSASTTWVTGVNNLVCWLLPIRNGVARKLSKPILSMNSFNFMCVSTPKLKKTLL